MPFTPFPLVLTYDHRTMIKTETFTIAISLLVKPRFYSHLASCPTKILSLFQDPPLHLVVGLLSLWRVVPLLSFLLFHDLGTWEWTGQLFRKMPLNWSLPAHPLISRFCVMEGICRGDGPSLLHRIWGVWCKCIDGPCQPWWLAEVVATKFHLGDVIIFLL